MVCLDQMGPIHALAYSGKRLVSRTRSLGTGQPKGRATFQATHAGKGHGHVFGAFCPHTGKAFTACHARRTKANYLGFLERVDAWLDPAATQVICVLDNLNIHHSAEVLLFMAAHPRWEFGFIPKGCAYLNLIEPWWKTLRSIALKGTSFNTWDEVVAAITAATTYWNAHAHPYLWGHRRRHRTPRKPGIAVVHKLAG